MLTKLLKKKKGLSTSEYALIIVTIVTALIVMQLYIKRAAQGKLRDSADQIGQQFDPSATISNHATSTSGTTVQETEDGTTTTFNDGTDGRTAMQTTKSGHEIVLAWKNTSNKGGAGTGTGTGSGTGSDGSESGSGGSGGTDTGGSGTGGGGGTGGSGTGGGGGVTYDSAISRALNLLCDASAGAYYCSLIEDKNISVIFDDFSKYGIDNSTLAFWAGIGYNTIFVNSVLKSQSPESAIAAVINHEATHADYSYYPQKWIDETLTKYPGLTTDDIHIDSYPYNSVDQEYNAFATMVSVWGQVKGSSSDLNCDTWTSIYNQGESYMKSQIRSAYSDQGLPEF